MKLVDVVALLVACLAVLGVLAAVVSEVDLTINQPPGPHVVSTHKALVFQGGGAKGAYEVGTLQRLCDNGQLQNVKHLVGTSIGALNAVYLAQFSSDKLCDGVHSLSKVWRSINSSKEVIQRINGGACGYESFHAILELIRPDFFFKYPCTMAPTDLIYRNHISMELVKQSGMTLDIAMASLEDGEVHYCSDLTCAKASGSLAPIVEPVRTIHGRFMDGGVRANLPLLRALERGSNEVHVLFASQISPPAIESERYFSGYAKFFFDVFFDEQLMDALQYACLKYPRAHISADVPVGDTGGLLEFEPENIKKLIRDGRFGRRGFVPDLCEHMKMDRFQRQSPHRTTHLINYVTLAIGFLLLCVALYKPIQGLLQTCKRSQSGARCINVSSRVLVQV